MPDSNGDPRDSLIGLFTAVKKDYGPGGIRVEVGHVGIMPVWGENNRNQIASGRAKKPEIHPVLIDREIPKLQTQLDSLNKIVVANKAGASAPALTAGQKKDFIDLTNDLKVLSNRREKILARTGDEYVTEPRKLKSNP
jgi:hypothetical protein